MLICVFLNLWMIVFLCIQSRFTGDFSHYFMYIYYFVDFWYSLLLWEVICHIYCSFHMMWQVLDFFFLLVCLHEGLSKSVNGCHIISEKFSLIIFFALFSPSSLYGILLDTSSQPLCLLNSPHVSIFTLLAFTLHSSVFP